MMQRQQITQKTGVALLIYLLSVSVLELFAYHFEGIFSILAAWVWALTGLTCLIAFFVTLGGFLKNDIKEKRLFLLFGYVLLLALFCSLIGNLSFSDVSYEAALQTAAGLSSFSAPDLNYTKVAFLNYANRQYVINALPSLFLGRSVFSLHLGFAFPFLLGMTLWFFELRCQLKERGLKEEFALLPVYALATFSYISEYFMNFEQTLTPVSYTMLGLALLLRFFRKRDVIGILALSFVGGMCCNAYTPVLAFFGFLLFFLAFWGIRALQKSQDTRELLVCFALFTQLLSYFTATLLTPQKSMISKVHGEVSFVDALFTSWFDFFSDTHASFWGIWLGAVLLYLFLACLFQLTLCDFLVTGWMLATVFFSSYMTGYTNYTKAHEIQRNMLILPVFLTALFFLLLRLLTLLKKTNHTSKLPRRMRTLLLPFTLLFFLLLSAFHFTRPHQSFLYQGYVQPVKYLFDYTEEILTENSTADTDEFNLVFLSDNRLQSNLADYCAYFYPNAHTYVAGVADFPKELDTALKTFVFSESELPPLSTLSVSGTSSRYSVRYRKKFVLYYME